ncbi:hypothetical protein J3F83DRAFT_662654 [Trichoderma novae-zelandiae]
MPQTPSATTSIQSQQTSGWRHAYPQSTTAPRPAPLQNSVTSSQPVMSLKSIVAPQPPMAAHSTMTAPSDRPPQPEPTPRWAAPAYPEIMPQHVLASQGMAAPQPPVILQSLYTQPAYAEQPVDSEPADMQPTYAPPPYSWPCCTQPACSEPGCSLSDCSRPYSPQPVDSQQVVAFQQANVVHPAASPRPLATSQPTIASNPSATPWPAAVSQAMTAAQQPVLPQDATFSQPIPSRTMTTSHAAGSPQQLAIRPAAADDSRSSSRGRESATLPQARDPRSLYDPKKSAIVRVTPSVGNKVVDYLMKHDPSVVAASQLSNTLPKETAVHYNSVLAYQAQSLGLSFPHGHPEFHNGIDPSIAPPSVVPAPRETQGMQPTIAHVGGTQPFHQFQSTEAPPLFGQLNAPDPQSDVQSHRGSGVPSTGGVDYGPTCCVGHPQQTLDAGSHGDIQEVSQMDWQAANEGSVGRQDHIQVATRQDWQAANKETNGRQFDQEAQPVVASAPQNTASQPPTCAPAKTQSVPQPCVKNNRGKMPLPRTHRPICGKPVSAKAQTALAKAQTSPTKVQAPKKATSKSKPTPASGGIQKRKSNRIGQATLPRPAAPQTSVPETAVPQAVVPQTDVPRTPLRSPGREQQPTAHVSGSGMELTQDDVDRWQEERQNPYRLPSFNDAFGHIIMGTCSTESEQTSYEAEGGGFNLAAYRI